MADSQSRFSRVGGLLPFFSRLAMTPSVSRPASSLYPRALEPGDASRSWPSSLQSAWRLQMFRKKCDCKPQKHGFINIYIYIIILYYIIIYIHCIYLENGIWGRAIYITPYYIIGYRDIVIIPGKAIKKNIPGKPDGFRHHGRPFVFVLGLSH